MPGYVLGKKPSPNKHRAAQAGISRVQKLQLIECLLPVMRCPLLAFFLIFFLFSFLSATPKMLIFVPFPNHFGRKDFPSLYSIYILFSSIFIQLGNLKQ